jgi:hypothetical protein
MVGATNSEEKALLTAKQLTGSGRRKRKSRWIAGERSSRVCKARRELVAAEHPTARLQLERVHIGFPTKTPKEKRSKKEEEDTKVESNCAWLGAEARNLQTRRSWPSQSSW